MDHWITLVSVKVDPYETVGEIHVRFVLGKRARVVVKLSHKQVVRSSKIVHSSRLRGSGSLAATKKQLVIDIWAGVASGSLTAIEGDDRLRFPLGTRQKGTSIPCPQVTQSTSFL